MNGYKYVLTLYKAHYVYHSKTSKQLSKESISNAFPILQMKGLNSDKLSNFPKVTHSVSKNLNPGLPNLMPIRNPEYCY